MHFLLSISQEEEKFSLMIPLRARLDNAFSTSLSFQQCLSIFFLSIGSTRPMKTMSNDAPTGCPKTASSKVMPPDGEEELLSSATPGISQNW